MSSGISTMKISLALLLNILVVVVGAAYSHFASFASIEQKFQSKMKEQETLYLQTFATKESYSFLKETTVEIKNDVKDLKNNTAKDLQEIKRLLVKR